MVAISSDAFLKAIPEVFNHSSTHFDGCGHNFLPNFLLKFFQVCRRCLKPFTFEYPRGKKSQMLKSGERVGHSTSPLRVTRPLEEHLSQFHRRNWSCLGCSPVLLIFYRWNCNYPCKILLKNRLGTPKAMSCSRAACLSVLRKQLLLVWYFQAFIPLWALQLS